MNTAKYITGDNLLDAFDKYLSDVDVKEMALSIKIANSISFRRKELGLSQSELAKKLDVTQPVVSKLESGDINYTIRTIIETFNTLDLDFDFLIGKEIERYQASKVASAKWKNLPSLVDSEMQKILAKGA